MRAVWQLYPWLEQVMYEHAVLAVPALSKVGNSTSALLAAVEDRSRRYTSDRDGLAKPTDPIADLAARALFFSIVDAPKIQIPLQELHRSGGLALHDDAPLRVIDVGAGCGAMSLGLLDFWSRHQAKRPLQIALFERDADALRIAVAALTAAAKRFSIVCDIRSLVADVTTTQLEECDLVIAGTVLNELANTAQLQLVQRMLNVVGDKGNVIIIEPALRSTSRDLHRLRDALLLRRAARVLAPCTKNDAPCPALAQEQDWCHEDRLTKLPPRAHELARITGLRDAGLKFSYLLLGSMAGPQDLAPPSTRLIQLRVMSSARALKGQIQVAVCGHVGWQTVRLLRRHRTERNEQLTDAVRGDVVQLDTGSPVDLCSGSGLVAARIDVTAETRIQRLALPQVSAAPGDDESETHS